MSSEEPSTSSKPSTTPPSSRSPKGTCAVCGDVANGRRYGAMSCLGCIVFFRRTCLRNMKYRCQRQGCCEITTETRCVCRSCRMKKCLDVGMNPESIQIRDVIGPRRPRPQSRSPQLPSPSSSLPPSVPEALNIGVFLELQKNQREQHCTEEEKKFTEGCVYMKNDYHHRATSSDINHSLKLAIEDSTDFAAHFQFFQNLTEPQRRAFLAEYSIAFMLIDQAVKTINEADDGFWLMQNGSFLGLHPDFKFDEDMADEESERCHFEFVTQLLSTLAAPFRRLKLSDFESTVIKLLLLIPVTQPVLRNQVTQNFMEHLSMDAERFGEIILLISSIRCAVKAFYNMTKVSDLFSSENFEQVVRDVLVE
ncbi:hypothetical protein GCK72_021306 [Caenorhabditis remanei]|uniref:Nuclear receptor domain-containing protein n=1 Tax=Caenorhabditis remanei TaxID=31234 RepID=A0A6A5GJR7_CAERE|nr:hypothetical protein GCK72_021306 [Caenorhabditis remanei]KAF1754742.1 hypothetical protein GCK72_021306 [Caenorhabditis remanei]